VGRVEEWSSSAGIGGGRGLRTPFCMVCGEFLCGLVKLDCCFVMCLAMGLSLCLYVEDVGPSGRGSKVGCGKVVVIACNLIVALLRLGNAAMGMRLEKCDQGVQSFLKTQGCY
jgi:hypothetical protein